MPFVVALMIVVLALVIVLLATCAHLLARVMRVEGALRAATGPDGVLGSVESIGLPIVRQGAPLPAAIGSEVSVDPKAGSLALHVVSAGCASCRPIVEPAAFFDEEPAEATRELLEARVGRLEVQAPQGPAREHMVEHARDTVEHHAGTDDARMPDHRQVRVAVAEVG